MIRDRVYQISVTNGLGDFVLIPVEGYQPFSIFDQDAVLSYAIIGTSQWEVGLGYINGSGHLVRETILSSSTGEKVSFTDGVKDVINTAPALMLQNHIGAEAPEHTYNGQFWWDGEVLRIYADGWNIVNGSTS